MRLIELYIENFGKLTNYKYTFSSGLNVINEENGYGKSTLSVFIKSMLFGLEDTRRPKLDENDRKKYLPWQGGVFGGTLTFSVGDKKYRIERTFAPKAADDTFTLYDCESGKVSGDYTANLGEELFGINADGFERTVFLSERKFSVKNDNKTISAKLSDLVGCDGDVGELDDAIDALEERRKYYYKKGGAGKISEVKTQLTYVETEINDTIRIKDALPAKEARLAAAVNEIRDLEHKVAEFNSQKQTLSYEKQYLTKRAAKEETERKFAEAKEFFKGGVPTQAELRQAERTSDEYKALKEKIAIAKDTPDRRAILNRDLEEADGYIEQIRSGKGDKKKKAKAYPSLFVLAAVLLATGAIFIATVSVFGGIALLSAGVIALIVGLINLGACKNNATESKRTAGIKALLGREGMSHTNESEFLGALLEIKVKKETELALFEEKIAEIQRDSDRLFALGRERDEFLMKYQTESADPYSEIRAKLADYDYLSERVKELSSELAYIVREYGVNVEKLNRGNIIINELTNNERSDLEERIRRLRGEVALLERECRHDTEEAARLDELNEKRAELSERLEECRDRLNIINLTKEHLNKAKDLLTAKYLGKTRAAFADYMTAIGNEDPELFTMDTSFGIMKIEGGQSKPTEAYSLGTRDFFALASRFALIDSLYEKELPFIILDDPFAHFDDKKCATALKMLKRLGDRKQIIYFTCSRSRAV